ncbi:flagellar export chaperone FliS [Alcaligenaceae bacterium]|nr:flagellar export chaperone FliS [Alcaligenaceae bacterium]
MNYSVRRGPRHAFSAQAYANVGLETEVLSANPQQLITLLFKGAQAAILKARLHMQNDNIAGRGEAISKAIDIVDSGLKASVNLDNGGEVATNLVTTYELIIRNLLLANLNADQEKLDLAERLLNDISQAWQTIADSPQATVNQG